MPSRYRKKSLSKGTLPKTRNWRIEYFRCPRCGLIGVGSTYTNWLRCGIRYCDLSVDLRRFRVSKEDYDKLWG